MEGLKQSFIFDNPLSDYNNPGIGGFNSTVESGVKVTFGPAAAANAPDVNHENVFEIT